MKKILLFFALCCSLIGGAQEVTFTAEVSRKSLGENERLRIDFKINKDGDNFSAPNFEGFEVSGPTQSISNSWVNGVRSFSKTFTYVLSPKRKGKITIGSASIEVEGKVFKTNPLTVEVTDAVANPKNNVSSTPRMSGFSGFPFGFDPFGDSEPQDIEVVEPQANQLFVTTEVSKSSVYVNEPVSVVYKIYLAPTYGVAGFKDLKMPNFKNFWNQQLSDEVSVSECSYEGKTYRCITLKKVLLYPQQAGEQVVEPLAVTLDIQMPTNQVDYWGQRSYVTREKILRSQSQKIKVKSLPEQGKPASFSGAVGKFSLEVQIPKKQINAGETLKAEISVEGTGNFKLFEKPKLVFPPALEVYAPETKENVTSSLSGMKGKISEVYTLVPQYKGNFPLQPLEFSYFNPETEKYETLTSEKQLIEVLNGTNYQAKEEDGKLSSNEFAGLKQDIDLQEIKHSSFLGSFKFYLYLLLPLLLIPLFILLKNSYDKQHGDTQENRIKRTNKLAKKYLSTAKKYLQNKDIFYESLEKGLHTYLKAKLHLSTTELSKANIADLLAQKGVQKADIEDFVQLLSNCEKARYSPYTQADIDNDYAKAVEVITVLDKQMK